MGYVLKRINHLLGKAIHQYGMIRDKDRVLVAVSGGKDSLALLSLLKQHRSRVPISYDLTAVHLDPGFGGGSSRRVEDYFRQESVDYRIIKTKIGPLAHSPFNRENPCFLCSRLRRKIIFEIAGETGCSKIAFGHHKDDVIETFFINLLYGGSISTMMPIQPFFGGKYMVIRPLYLVDEVMIDRYCAQLNLPVSELGCPSAGVSKRRAVKDLLAGIYGSSRKIKGNIFNALHNVREGYLPAFSKDGVKGAGIREDPKGDTPSL
jgi:tRNA 2-thiocytidine biosynthesis protein TtcA